MLHRIIFSRPAAQPTLDNGWISDHDRRRVHLPFREEKEPFIHQRLRVEARGLFVLPISTLQGTGYRSYLIMMG